MIRITDIQTAFKGLVGWSEATDTDLKASSSGLYFEQAHPLITKANIASMLTDGSTAEDYMESVVDDGVAAMVNHYPQRREQATLRA